MVYSRVEDFLKDDSFIEFVLGDARVEGPWEVLLSENPKIRPIFLEAESILLGTECDVSSIFCQREQKDLRDSIFNDINRINK